MATADWIRLSIPFIAFALGLVSAFIIQRKTRERAAVAWTVLAENSLFSKATAAEVKLPVQVLVNDEKQDSLTAVTLRLGSAGNKVLEDLKVTLRFNKQTKIFSVRPVQQLGEYRKCITTKRGQGNLTLTFSHLNPEHRTIDFQLLLGNYEDGSLEVDLAAPGVTLHRRDSTKWDVQVPFLRGLALSMMGVRYDPTVSPLSDIAEELRDLKRLVSDGSFFGTQELAETPAVETATESHAEATSNADAKKAT